MTTHDEAREIVAQYIGAERSALLAYISDQESAELERRQQAARLERIKSHAGSTAQKLDEELQEADDASRRAGYDPELMSPARVIDDLHEKLGGSEARRAPVSAKP